MLVAALLFFVAGLIGKKTAVYVPVGIVWLMLAAVRRSRRLKSGG